jgi:hypothetical protein
LAHIPVLLLVQHGTSAVKGKNRVRLLSTCPPYKAQFSDSSLGNPDAWFWDFGNGETSTSQNSSATYKSPGYYTVKLKVQKGHHQILLIKWCMYWGKSQL